MSVDNGVILQRLGEISTTVTKLVGDVAAVKTTAQATLEQATKTNGRVTVAEGEIGHLQTEVALLKRDEEHDTKDSARADEERRAHRDAKREGKWLVASAAAGAACAEFLPRMLHAIGIG